MPWYILTLLDVRRQEQPCWGEELGQRHQRAAKDPSKTLHVDIGISACLGLAKQILMEIVLGFLPDVRKSLQKFCLNIHGIFSYISKTFTNPSIDFVKIFQGCSRSRDGVNCVNCATKLWSPNLEQNALKTLNHYKLFRFIHQSWFQRVAKKLFGQIISINSTTRRQVCIASNAS